MSDSLGDRIRSEAAIASRHGQYHNLMQIADEVDDAIMALVRSNQRLTDGRGGEATRAVDPPAAEPLIDPDDLAAASFIGPLAVMAYLRSVLTPEALEGVGVGIVVELLPDHWVISRSVSDLHRRIFGDAG